MKHKKIRKRSGWFTEKLMIKEKRDFIINNDLEPRRLYNDWMNYRDGQRDFYNDRTKFKPKHLIKWICGFDARKNNAKLEKKRIIRLKKRLKLRKLQVLSL